MEAQIGQRGVRQFRRDKLAVAQGSRVLNLVESRRRAAAFCELGVYLRMVGITRPRQFLGLVAAVLLGPGSHRRLKEFAS
jgi:hypothetical protein